MGRKIKSRKKRKKLFFLNAKLSWQDGWLKIQHLENQGYIKHK